MDIRAEFEKVVQQYGRPILLIRNSSKIKCSCWDMQYGPKKTCPICLGTGYLFTAEKHIARERTTAIPETLARAIRDSDLGNVTVPSRAYYLDYTVEPEIQDYIMECDWDEHGRPVFNKYSGLYQINYPEPFRGTSGRIEYFKVACKYDPVMVTSFKANIAKHLNISTYNVAIGGI